MSSHNSIYINTKLSQENEYMNKNRIIVLKNESKYNIFSSAYIIIVIV